MYFVHPQIKLGKENLKRLLFSFIKETEKDFLKNLQENSSEREIIFTDMGRSAFKLVIEALELQNSKMFFPAYICDIFYPIFKQYNISPIFLDADKKTFNISLEDLSQKVKKEKARAIFVTHTYGLKVDLKKVREIVGKETLIIEDCAHALCHRKDILENDLEISDAVIFSLYKSLPTARGGAAILKNKNLKVFSSLPQTNFNLRDMISLLNSFSFFAYLFKRFGASIAPKVQRQEKIKKPSQLNKISLRLFLNFLDYFEATYPNRLKLALFLQEELQKLGFEVQEKENNCFIYLSALSPTNVDRDKLVKNLKKHKVFCTRIWHTPIILNPKVQQEYHLNLSHFPATLEIAKRVINFPLQNFYSLEDGKKIIFFLKKSLKEI